MGQTDSIGNPCLNLNVFIQDHNIANDSTPDFVDIITNNVIYLNQDELVSAGGIDNQHQVLKADAETTFGLIRETSGRLDETKFYQRFQQYYKGVLVDGGGYTTVSRVVDGPSGPNDPCEGAFMLAPQIFSSIDIDVNPQINDAQITQIINGNVIDSKELIIQHNTYQNCGYDLFWKVKFDEATQGDQFSFINAKTGELTKTVSSHQHLNAPTEDYGTVSLDDFTAGNTTTLKNADESIITYDFTAMGGVINFTHLGDTSIPTTTGSTWSSVVAHPRVYQAHYVTTQAVDHLSTLGISFDKIHIVANTINGNATVIENAVNSDILIEYGWTNFTSLAVHDVAAHELSHPFLNQYLNKFNFNARSLQEGIADMFGVYSEHLQQQGTIDWEMGDDNDNVVRNLSNPNFSCYDDVKDMDDFNIDDEHERGEPLGHWFYLITEGNTSLGIPALGINTSIHVVIDALNLIGMNSDYPELRDKTLFITEDQFGLCSDEYIAVYRAWEEICLAPSTEQLCTFSVNGPYQVCEEDEYAVFCIEGGLPDAHYRWRIFGPMSTGYESFCGMIGNTQNGCNCLTLTDFPNYPYYPQNITIEISTLGQSYTVRKYLRLIDCNGDDPTCEEYYSLDGLIQENETQLIQSKLGIEDMNDLHAENNQLTVYNILGHLIYKGNMVNWTEQDVPQSGIYLFIYSDKNGTFIRQEKRALIKNF